MHDFMERINPQWDTVNMLLVLDGEQLCLQELLFLIAILERNFRDPFVLSYAGEPTAYTKWASNTIQFRQWAPCDRDSFNTIFDWLKLSASRIGMPSLEFQLKDPRFQDEDFVQSLILRQVEIERVRNPALVAVWFSSRSMTPLHKNVEASPRALQDNPERDNPERDNGRSDADTSRDEKVDVKPPLTIHQTARNDYSVVGNCYLIITKFSLKVVQMSCLQPTRNSPKWRKSLQCKWRKSLQRKSKRRL